MKKIGHKNTWILVGLLLFAAIINIPFCNQAFHMDDGIYLLLAKNIQRDFWFPQDRPVYFSIFSST